MIEDIILRDIKNISKHEDEENYYKLVKVNNFWSNNYIVYENKGDRKKTLLVGEYFNKIRPCLKDIINNHKKSDTWKIQLTIAINCISSKDNDEERVEADDETDEVIKELFRFTISK